MNPRDRKKAQTMSQIVPFPKPISASLVFRMPRMAQKVRDRNATAPIGMGRRINPAIVATKTAKSVQAFGESPSGHGNSHTASPRASTISQLLSCVIIISSL